ncbi:MAG TPA: TetR/AcrR family transcriptional regulator [Mycobacteriales bacterium]|uniref:TetR/AcrR family transcriptional regulator n=1 Tax=Humibacter sp. TaxID=1940291 RepID=UPI002C2EB7AA|nr:TetR/AcrR family transcriptional regulator [Humibacter sp.]HVW80829.1 TetR/AcrR family transcriptional regulator [Mycobacteriales bacterium]HVX08803.1 TetR/AcrR family transcriptional regulator [Humibacter sp.]
MTSQRHTSSETRPGWVSGAATSPVPVEIASAVRDSVLAVGVRRTTLTDVARRAGVSRMTLYRMVPDVETLILTVMTRDFAALLLEAESRAARKRTARGRLVAMTVDVARRLPEEPLFRRVIDVDPDLLLPYLTERLGSTQRFAIEHVQGLIAAGHRDGSIRKGDPEVMATSALVAVLPFVVSARLLDDVGRDRALDELGVGLDGWLRP